jgi:predicted enzyme related to lactoylglutathione lyase
MGKRSSYEPGTFSWIELATTDPDAAKSFYGGLFGWEAEDSEIPDGGGVYSMMKLSGEHVAAITTQPQQQREAGVPPNWFSYITVASADETSAAAKQAGGAVHAGPFDVMDAGRMAVIADPTGAMFGAWEPRENIGATLVNDPGCLTANELSTNDVAAATKFYEAVFGWKIDPIDTGGAPPYWAILHDGAAQGRNGGMRELSPPQVEAGVPPHWMPYFTVTSVDETVKTATDAGGHLGFGPMDLPMGARIAVIGDPQGAFFALFQGEVDD